MEDINDYWKIMDYPPVFTNIDWNESQVNHQQQGNNFIPMEYDQQKIPPSYQHQPFQRRRSSSVDLPINPLYSNTNRLIINNTEPTIIEEEFIPPNFIISSTTRNNRIGSSATLEFPGWISYANNNYIVDSPPPLSTTSSSAMMSSPVPPPPPPAAHPTTKATMPKKTPSPPPQQQQQTITFFPELHRTSYNSILGKQLKQHQKRRRSSSLPPAFHKQRQQPHVPTPLIFTQIQVTDPTPIQHIQKAAKVDTRPVAIERVHKPVLKPVTLDPVETQKKLEDDLIQLNFEDVTVAELKDMLRERGLPATGKKAVLTHRLRDARDVLVKKKWLRTDSASPNLQGLANMTIHSPAPPTENLFLPMDNNKNEYFSSSTRDSPMYPIASIKTEPITPNKDTSYQYQPTNTNELIDINDIFNFDNNTIDDSILYPPPQPWDDHGGVEWDQDKLDLFLTELV